MYGKIALQWQTPSGPVWRNPSRNSLSMTSHGASKTEFGVTCRQSVKIMPFLYAHDAYYFAIHEGYLRVPFGGMGCEKLSKINVIKIGVASVVFPGGVPSRLRAPSFCQKQDSDRGLVSISGDLNLYRDISPRILQLFLGKMTLGRFFQNPHVRRIWWLAPKFRFVNSGGSGIPFRFVKMILVGDSVPWKRGQWRAIEMPWV